MTCFWTDLVGVAQVCAGAAPAVLTLAVYNSTVSSSGGSTALSVDWFNPTADFSTLVDGIDTLFVYDGGLDRWQHTNIALPMCPGSGGEGAGTLTQGSNSVAIIQTLQCS